MLGYVDEKGHHTEDWNHDLHGAKHDIDETTFGLFDSFEVAEHLGGAVEVLGILH